MRYTAYVNSIVQALGWAVQIANAIAGSGYLSPKGQAAVAGIVGAIMAILGVLAHFKNPDGTPAAVAYVKKL